jgi:hypothetical protein
MRRRDLLASGVALAGTLAAPFVFARTQALVRAALVIGMNKSWDASDVKRSCIGSPHDRGLATQRIL